MSEQSANPRPHSDLREVLAPGSNVEYLSREEYGRVMAEFAAIARGLGRFARPTSEHEHRLALERGRRR